MHPWSGHGFYRPDWACYGEGLVEPENVRAAVDNLCRLAVIMAQLRDPECGCPWDLKQDFRDIARHTLEEAYEVVEAIEREDWHELLEELGDLLFQVYYHAQIARERNLFDLDDVARRVGNKLVERHPHVFGECSAGDEAALREAWERRKAEERRAKGLGESHMDGVALALPALARAKKLQARAARAGLDWPDVEGVVEKIREELGELAQARREGDHAAMEEEIGDLLFSVVNLARHLDVDPEQALRGANRKFEQRVRSVEARASAQGRALEDLDPAALARHWEAAKAERKTT